MQFNFRGIYDSNTAYAVQDVISYQATSNSTVNYYYCIQANTGQVPLVGQDSQYWAVVNALSNFPNSVDSFLSRVNIQASDKDDLTTFQTLSLQTSLTPDQQDQLSQLTQKLRNKLILPDDWNALQASISNMQMFLQNSVVGYINQKQAEFDAQVEKFADKGAYVSTTTYMQNNFVTYQNQTYLCTVDNTVNIPPTNTSNWRLAAAQGATGAQGLPGLNLVFQGTYDPTIQYATGNAVQYNGSIYYATQASVGETPQSNGTSWTIFMARSSVLVSPTPPTSPVDGMVWVDSSVNLFKYYVASSSSWVATSDFGSKIGDLTKLNTTAKDSLVNAINENQTNIGKNTTNITNNTNNIGDITTLTTTDKSNLVNALNSHSSNYVKHPGYGSATGSANTYAITLSPAPTTYVDGMGVTVKINVDATGSSTLNVNSLGAIPLKGTTGNDVTTLKTNGVYTFRYNSTTGNFILQGEGSDPSSLITSTNGILGS